MFVLIGAVAFMGHVVDGVCDEKPMKTRSLLLDVQ